MLQIKCFCKWNCYCCRWLWCN